MKWKTRSITFNLLAGLIALMCNGCKGEQPSIRLVSSQLLDFPSASGIEYHQGRLFLFGDNAPHFLVLSTTYQPIQKLAYWRDTTAVISKEEKPDVESAMIVETAGQLSLFGVGSFSGKNRRLVYAWTLGSDTVGQTKFFNDDISFPGIDEINIEGSTAVNGTLVFSNRANLTTKKNHLIFRNGQERTVVKEIRLPETGSTPGISGLCYVKEKDLLLFTASEEATYNAVEDGEIGESYLGWIADFSSGSKASVIQASGLLQLSSFAPAFKGQKIEGICAESVKGNRYRLHLVADNDNGKSGLFTVDLER